MATWHWVKITFINPEQTTLPQNAAEILTDGKRGSCDFTFNWLVVSGGKDLEVVIDLEEEKMVRRMSSSYFQYGFWLRLFPRQVEYLISRDGITYERVGAVDNTLPIDQYGGQQRDFIVECKPQKARFVKMIAHSIGNTPDWHPGSGRPANMLIDEIVVE
ncbi:MAG: discoidin domain-containing protein [Bacteroidia bacterium]